ncbi:MAG: hypothetical protein ACLU1W_09040 [Collinsella sp.]
MEEDRPDRRTGQRADVRYGDEIVRNTTKRRREIDKQKAMNEQEVNQDRG